MSSLKEIVENEGQRDSLDKCGTAFLYREGSFYRAYEWSAWLFVRHVSDFKVTCRVFKAVEQAVAFIGFPLTSAGKFMPDGFTAKPLSDSSLQVSFPSSLIADDADLAALAQEFAQWKQSVPVAESQRQKLMTTEANPSTSHFSRPQSLTQIMQRVLAYPIESKSPMDSMLFLADIKQQLSAII